MDINIDDLDVQVAEIAWDINRVKSPSKNLIETVEFLFQTYQKYTLGDQSLRGDVKDLVEFIQPFLGIKGNNRDTSIITTHQPIPIYVQTNGGAEDEEDEEEKQARIAQEEIIRNRQRGKSQIEAIRNQLFQSVPKKLKQVVETQALQAGVEIGDSKNLLINVMKAQEEIHQNMIAMFNALNDKLDNIAEKHGAQNNLITSTMINKDQANKIDKLYQMQMAKGDIFDIPFRELPAFIKARVAKNFKKLMWEAIKLPYTVLKKTTSNLIYNPMKMAIESISKWLLITWGFVLWTIVIGGIVMFYYTYDFSTVNNLYEHYGGNVIISYVISPLRETTIFGRDYTYKIANYHWDLWIKDLHNSIFQALKGVASVVLAYFSQFIKEAIKSLISPSSWLPSWMSGKGKIDPTLFLD